MVRAGPTPLNLNGAEIRGGRSAVGRTQRSRKAVAEVDDWTVEHDGGG